MSSLTPRLQEIVDALPLRLFVDGGDPLREIELPPRP
jgi:hypothetical protein